MLKLTASAKDTFGTVSVAMVTPFDKENKLDINRALQLAEQLIEDGCDSLVIGGTTGESPTTTTKEKLILLQELMSAFSNRVQLIQGVGTNSTSNSIEFMREVDKLSPDGILMVTPYYSKPSQEGIFEHIQQVLSYTSLPTMLYDIPGRTGVELSADTLKRLAEIDNVLAVKDAKGNIPAGIQIMKDTELAYYSGDDSLNLPWLAVGAVGVVSVIGHFVAGELKELIKNVNVGDLESARKISADLMPLAQAVTQIGGVALVKTGYQILNQSVGIPRSPLLLANSEDTEWLQAILKNYR